MTVENAVVVDINRLNAEFWDRRQVVVNELMVKKYVCQITAKREARKARFVALATCEAERLERIRNQPTFEQELEYVAEDLGLLPIFKAQRERAAKPRGRITDDGLTTNDVIRELALRAEYQTLRTKELWPHFFNELDRLDLNPTDIADPAHFDRWVYEYDFNDRRKRMTYGQFANLVARFRKQEKIRLAGLTTD